MSGSDVAVAAVLGSWVGILIGLYCGHAIRDGEVAGLKHQVGDLLRTLRSVEWIRAPGDLSRDPREWTFCPSCKAWRPDGVKHKAGCELDARLTRKG